MVDLLRDDRVDDDDMACSKNLFATSFGVRHFRAVVSDRVDTGVDAVVVVVGVSLVEVGVEAGSEKLMVEVTMDWRLDGGC